MKRGAFTLLFLFALAASVGCAARKTAALYDPQALPTGPVGETIARGHALITQTRRLMRAYVGADLTCADCHLGAGTQARGGSFIGTYARFPQWNGRAHRVITLHDRIAECFLYSMNGRAPAYDGKAMVAIVAYIAWLSRNTPVGAPQPVSDRYLEPLPSASPSAAAGARLYAQKCSVCHGADGNGVANVFPPLWGTTSFNNGAGMAHIDRMTGFIRYNMPQNAPGSLSLAQAYDVATFVLSHPRPHFRKGVLQFTPALPAKYF
ncbi:MAG TPA: c-type cytochrome [Candidatus Cybelea sp.]|jgi:thiosulfate dehydrogenase|nr:c-type cytochrome [Candidatus Cybelea sp.]